MGSRHVVESISFTEFLKKGRGKLGVIAGDKFTLEPVLLEYMCRVVYKFSSSRSFGKSRRLWVQRTHTMGFSPSFVGGSGGMLPRKIFENWNAGKCISGILGHEAQTSEE